MDDGQFGPDGSNECGGAGFVTSSRLILASVLLSACLCAAGQAAVFGRAFSLSEYVVELDRLDGARPLLEDHE